MKKTGFTLIEVLAALAVSSAMVMAIGSGLIHTLQQESAARRKQEATLLLESIACARKLPEGRAKMFASHADEWLIVEHELEDGDDRWKAWQITPSDRKSSTWSVFFTCRD